MQIKSFVTEFIYEEDDNTFEFHFEFESDGLKSTVFISEPYLNSYEEWKKMIDAIKNNEKYDLGFYCGNGIGTMECNGENLLFIAMPSGAGGDIEVSASISIKKYKDILIKNIQSLIDHEYAQKYWTKNK